MPQVEDRIKNMLQAAGFEQKEDEENMFRAIERYMLLMEGDLFDLNAKSRTDDDFLKGVIHTHEEENKNRSSEQNNLEEKNRGLIAALSNAQSRLVSSQNLLTELKSELPKQDGTTIQQILDKNKLHEETVEVYANIEDNKMYLTLFGTDVKGLVLTIPLNTVAIEEDNPPKKLENKND